MTREKNISRIRDALLNRVGNLAKKEEIGLVIKEFNRIFKKELDADRTIKYLSRHNYIKRIFLSYYYINSLDERKRGYCRFEDKELLFSVLNKLDIRWYLGLGSAMYESGEVWQVPVRINIINNSFSGKRNILGLNVRFYKMKEELIFGLKKGKTKNHIGYFYSEPAKTYIDMVYLRLSDRLTNKEKTKNYLKRFPRWVGKSST